MGYFSKITISNREQALVYEQDGSVALVEGPARISTYKRRVKMLKHYAASQHEYLVVNFIDGHKQHIPGPTAMFMNPEEHTRVSVQAAISINASEVLVVYTRRTDDDIASEKARIAAEREEAAAARDGKRRKKSTKTPLVNQPPEIGLVADTEPTNVVRSVVRGPCLHVPSADEWLHSFEWHGSDRNNKTRKVPKGTQFTKLRTIADQFYYNVSDVRTSDDALVVVKIMLFFQLFSVERMLDTTHDPIADFINALTADVIYFASQRTYEEFVSDTNQLNELPTYVQLVRRAKRIGFDVTKVVYRGYHASDQLQQMHDRAIQARTQLRLQSETEEEAQKMADRKLDKEIERAERKQEMQQRDMDNKNKLAAKEHAQRMREQRAELDHAVAAEAEKDAAKIGYFEKLSALGVDLTRYMVSQHEHPDKVFKVIGDGDAMVHVHE